MANSEPRTGTRPQEARSLERPEITSYDRDELTTPQVFTGDTGSGADSDRRLKENMRRLPARGVLRELCELL